MTIGVFRELCSTKRGEAHLGTFRQMYIQYTEKDRSFPSEDVVLLLTISDKRMNLYLTIWEYFYEKSSHMCTVKNLDYRKQKLEHYIS